MKFRKPDNYAAPVQVAAPVAPRPEPVPLQIIEQKHDWECVGCPGKASVIHRGTTYCKPCYEKRAYGGTLVD